MHTGPSDFPDMYHQNDAYFWTEHVVCQADLGVMVTFDLSSVIFVMTFAKGLDRSRRVADIIIVLFDL